MITETQLSENKDDQQLIHATDLFIVHLLMKNLQVFVFFSTVTFVNVCIV